MCRQLVSAHMAQVSMTRNPATLIGMYLMMMPATSRPTPSRNPMTARIILRR